MTETMAPTGGWQDTVSSVRTMAEALLRSAADHPDVPAVRTADGSLSLTWAQVRDRAGAIAGGLATLGLGPGHTMAILLTNRPEFHVVDHAAMLLRAAPFSIYSTYPAEGMRHLLSDAGVRVAVVERQFLPVLLEARRGLPELEHVVVVDGDAPEGTLALAEVEARGAGFDVEAAARAVRADDLLTLIYTSGTTGPPKGVELTHTNILEAARVVAVLAQPEPGARIISWLPAAHIAERAAHHYLPTVFAASITCCTDPRQLLALMPQVRPRWFMAVPRIWEKLKAGSEAMLAQLPEQRRTAFEEALAAAIEKLRLEQRGEAVPAELAARVAAADVSHFATIRRMLGLDEVMSVMVGAAPTPVEVLEFFHAIGVELAEVWGMSESSAMGTANRPGAVRIGTVGPAAPGVELRLEEDGEVLIRGACVMRGYRNRPEQTRETIDEQGWLHTGDIGTLDEDGYLRIVDRKKELIINAAGKNMSPANIEATLKTSSPLIAYACCIGDRRPYNTALLALDSDVAPMWAAQHGLAGRSLAELAAEPAVRTSLEAAVDAANTRLARVEGIKRFTVVPTDWLPGGDELTPTMKLKRRAIAEKYAAEIEAMYAG
jgi:long-subunit acyl-CoA synthetase (AMP-forming)